MPVASIERLPAKGSSSKGASPSKGPSPSKSPSPSKPGAGDRVRVRPVKGNTREFDAVVLATHSDTALRLLGAGATDEERDVLGAIPYNR